MADRSRWFVSTEWLEAHLGDPDVAIVDGSWHMPSTGRNPEAEFKAQHVPGAVFFDIDRIADRTTALPHMLPSPADFEAAVGALGIAATQEIIVYDSRTFSAAARLWWTFRTMGAERVRILDGSLQKWIAEGRPTVSGEARPQPKQFRATFHPERLAGLERVRAALADPASVVIDGRPAGRYRGEDPEPRPGLRTGHMPGAVSLPGPELIDADGRLKDEAALRRAFADAGVDLARRAVASCGSGVVASTLALAAEMLSGRPAAVYDGSWTEWGGRPDTPVTTGP